MNDLSSGWDGGSFWGAIIASVLATFLGIFYARFQERNRAKAAKAKVIEDTAVAILTAVTHFVQAVEADCRSFLVHNAVGTLDNFKGAHCDLKLAMLRYRFVHTKSDADSMETEVNTLMEKLDQELKAQRSAANVRIAAGQPPQFLTDESVRYSTWIGDNHGRIDRFFELARKHASKGRYWTCIESKKIGRKVRKVLKILKVLDKHRIQKVLKVLDMHQIQKYNNKDTGRASNSKI